MSPGCLANRARRTGPTPQQAQAQQAWACQGLGLHATAGCRLLAQGQDQTGDTKAATKTWKQYVERAGAKGEHLAQAQARLAK